MIRVIGRCQIVSASERLSSNGLVIPVRASQVSTDSTKLPLWSYPGRCSHFFREAFPDIPQDKGRLLGSKADISLQQDCETFEDVQQGGHRQRHWAGPEDRGAAADGGGYRPSEGVQGGWRPAAVLRGAGQERPLPCGHPCGHQSLQGEEALCHPVTRGPTAQEPSIKMK